MPSNLFLQSEEITNNKMSDLKNRQKIKNWLHIRESNPRQLGDNQLYYHYTNVDCHDTLHNKFSRVA